MNGATTMKRTLMAGVIVAVAGTVGGGCVSTAPAPAMADPIALANYPGIEVEPGLQAFVVVSQPNIERREDGTISRISVPVRAATNDNEMNIQYEYKYFDAKGFPLKVQGGMRYMRLPMRKQMFLEDSPMDTTAKDVRLYIRSAR